MRAASWTAYGSAAGQTPKRDVPLSDPLPRMKPPLRLALELIKAAQNLDKTSGQGYTWRAETGRPHDGSHK
jgi:hypothetical protein